jgi:hypothetical protein
MTTLHVPADDPRLSWQGQLSLERVDGGLKPWRIPQADRELFPGVRDRACHAAGVRVAFETDAERLTIDAVHQAGDKGMTDVVVGDKVESVRLTDDPVEAELAGAGMRRVEVWLPQFGETVLRGFALPAGARVAAVPVDHRPRWLTYGSSITQCRQADSPTRTWPAIVARRAGLDLTNLGFGGQCHLDPAVARLIRDRPADYISICAGINSHWGALAERTYRAAWIGTILTVREGHPTTPLAMISPIYSPPRETMPGSSGLTLQAMRRITSEVAGLFRARGDTRLAYVDGLDCFGPDSIPTGADMDELMPDFLHPADAAQPILAQNVLRHVVAGVFGHTGSAV